MVQCMHLKLVSDPPDKSNHGPPPGDAWVNLGDYRVTGYEHRSRLLRAGWYLVGLVAFETGLPVPSGIKRTLLRWFGARIGEGVVIKPHVRIKFPWQLVVGNHTWIGEGTWIDNLAEVRLGSHVCISQGVYFCTGSHDHNKCSFDLLTAPIVVGDGAWVAARTTLLGGVAVGANALVAAGSLVNKEVPPAAIVGGNPAAFLRHRNPPAGNG
jgi:putative colanic acid biosynthesis acetyltransferase WcaF